jgi:hypothetical protein
MDSISGEDHAFWEKVFRKKEDIISRAIAGEMILVPLRGTLTDMQKIFSLNPVAGFIWEKLDGRKSLRELRDDLLATFDVEIGDANSDIQEFIAHLLKEGLIAELM